MCAPHTQVQKPVCAKFSDLACTVNAPARRTGIHHLCAYAPCIYVSPPVLKKTHETSLRQCGRRVSASCPKKKDGCVRGVYAWFLITTCGKRFPCVSWVVRHAEPADRANRENCAVGILLCSERNKNWPLLRAGETVSVKFVEQKWRE